MCSKRERINGQIQGNTTNRAAPNHHGDLEMISNTAVLDAAVFRPELWTGHVIQLICARDLLPVNSAVKQARCEITGRVTVTAFCFIVSLEF